MERRVGRLESAGRRVPDPYYYYASLLTSGSGGAAAAAAGAGAARCLLGPRGAPEPLRQGTEQAVPPLKRPSPPSRSSSAAAARQTRIPKLSSITASTASTASGLPTTVLPLLRPTELPPFLSR
ncbi:hypothetical protein H101_07915 [Trichophyton interdigitale H6]|nr:hypothetical protein H101_07915 [Trichophyton interdigitale H6]